MENSDTAGGAPAPTPDVSPAATDSATPDAGDGAHVQMDADTGHILGDVLAAGDATGDLGDLHAALASLSSDAISHLDIALDHLTSSADLFDTPAMDFGDIHHDFSTI